MIKSSKLWNYTRLSLYNIKKYKNVFVENHISGDEIALKDPQDGTYEYYYPLKKDKTNYLLPSEYKVDMPLKGSNIIKIPHKGKAFKLIQSVKSVKFGSVMTMPYKDMIDNWLPYNHLNQLEWTIHKIITDAAYCGRINVREMSYPSWGKDSPLLCLSLLRMDVVSATKPSYPKLKLLICQKNKIIGLNEIQKMNSEERTNISKYYETTGAFEPFITFDKRATGGVEEQADLENVSSMTYYNVPATDSELLFDDPLVFDPKHVGRIFPLFLSGGDHKVTAIQDTFSESVTSITDEDFDSINEWIQNHKYYEDNGHKLVENSIKKNWKIRHHFNQNRWERNYVTICNRLKLYADTESEFIHLEETLFQMHKRYVDYVSTYMNQGGLQ